MSKAQGEVRWTGARALGANDEEVYGESQGMCGVELAELQRKSII